MGKVCHPQLWLNTFFFRGQILLVLILSLGLLTLKTSAYRENRSLNHYYDTHTTMQVEQGMLLKISSSWSHPLSTQKYRPEPFQPHSPDVLSPRTTTTAVHILSWRHTNSTAPVFAQQLCFCEQRRNGTTRRKKKKKKNESVLQKLRESETPDFQKFLIISEKHIWTLIKESCIF